MFSNNFKSCEQLAQIAVIGAMEKFVLLLSARFEAFVLFIIPLATTPKIVADCYAIRTIACIRQ